MAFVLDCSVALAWVLPDEDEDDVDELMDRLEAESVFVPAIWPLEVGNALLAARQRRRIKDDDVTRFARALAVLPIEVDQDGGAAALGPVLDLARKLGLTTYDAAYLELARRRSVPLATIDGPLRRACAASRIRVLP